MKLAILYRLESLLLDEQSMIFHYHIIRSLSLSVQVQKENSRKI